MAYIRSVKGLEILDSRGNPTLEVILTTDQNVVSKASVPSGASTGSFEACEKRDLDQDRYFGKGVKEAVGRVNGPIAEVLIGEHVFDQDLLDHLMIEADGTENKSRFGANAILGASMALARAAAQTAKLPLYRYLGGSHTYILPCPMMNIINGGAHADNMLDFQEFMICPKGAPSFREAIRFGSQIFHTLKTILQAEGLSTGVGDEGGFAPAIDSNEKALDLILFAIEKAGFIPGSQVSIALDCAASEFFDKKNKVYFEKKKQLRHLGYQERSREEQIQYLTDLCKAYPIDSIEDGLDENDWEGWTALTKALPETQIVGDDLFVTNPKFLRKGIMQKAANSILIKPNQIGTVTETLETIRIAQNHSFHAIISHRSGETEDTFISDLAVAVNAGQIKAGSLSRTDRVAKYNRLLNIEEGLGSIAKYRR